MNIKRCNDRKTLIKIAELVYDCYYSAGYIPKNSFSIWLTHLQLLPDCEIYYVEDRGKILCTGSICFEDKTGIPAKVNFREIVDSIPGKKAEFICFASIGTLNPTMELIVYMHKRVYDLGYDYLVAEVNPRHERFYAKVLGFDELARVEGHMYVQAESVLFGAPVKELPKRVNKYFYNKFVRKYYE